MTATTTIAKWGNSQAIRLPKTFLDSLDLKDNDTVEVFLNNDKIIIKKKYKHKTFKERVEEFYGKDFETVVTENLYEFEETEWGKPVGEEIW
jgi:Growth regulator